MTDKKRLRDLSQEGTAIILQMVRALGFKPERQEHEILTRAKWRADVAQELTSLGYVQYVAQSLSMQDDPP